MIIYFKIDGDNIRETLEYLYSSGYILYDYKITDNTIFIYFSFFLNSRLNNYLAIDNELYDHKIVFITTFLPENFTDIKKYKRMLKLKKNVKIKKPAKLAGFCFIYLN